MPQVVIRHSYWIAVGATLAAIAVLSGWMAINIAIPELERAGVIAAAPTPTPTAEPTASPSPSAPIIMGGAILPAGAQCAGCHQTTTGAIGLREIPVMAHPQEGWSKCISCHATARLVDTAPGHTGIHASECTVCHKAGDLPAPLSRPHRVNENVACLSCHGSSAPLPSDMTHRAESVCWLCHRLPTIEPPVPAHETAPGEADCRTCHVGGGSAGKLPADHLERPASLCLSCHEVTLGATPSETPPVVTWPAPSASPPPSALASPSVPPVAPISR
jgi:hypothetical protein